MLVSVLYHPFPQGAASRNLSLVIFFDIESRLTRCRLSSTSPSENQASRFDLSSDFFSLLFFFRFSYTGKPVSHPLLEPTNSAPLMFACVTDLNILFRPGPSPWTSRFPNSSSEERRLDNPAIVPFPPQMCTRTSLFRPPPFQ